MDDPKIIHLALPASNLAAGNSKELAGSCRDCGKTLGSGIAAPVAGQPEEEMQPMADNEQNNNFIELTADIVSAYVSNNTVAASELAGLIGDVHGALSRIVTGVQEAPVEAPKPAIAVKRSITPDYIICLEDGKKFKSLKRHLRTQYNMTPEQYREKWGLPADYPMVAPNYAEARSKLAKEMGLGQQRRKTTRRGRA
jgi:predicted transcriptional regulator